MLDRLSERPSDTSTDAISDAWRAVGEELSGYSSLLLAVSGGPDSLAMLVGLAKLRDSKLLAPSIAVETIDHGLRAEAADEAQMVREVCAELGVPFHVTKLGRKPFARNAQDWARVQRYGVLSERAGETQSVVLTAHTADDQAETLLMRAARGTGCEGLAGIRPQTRLQGALVVRPFLDWPRAELHAILDETPWRPSEDPSNGDESYTRVRFRHWLADAPRPDGARGVVDGFAETAQIAGLETAALDHYANQLFDQVGGASYGFVDGNLALCDQPLVVQARVLRMVLSAVARRQTSSMGDRNLSFGLGRMVALARRIANEPGGKWVGGGAVLEWQSAEGLEHLSAYGEAGRSGFPELSLGPGEHGRWDDRFEVCNWSDESVIVRAWQSEDRKPEFDRERVSKSILASLPVAECDGEVIAMVGASERQACQEAGTVFLGVFPSESSA